MRTVVGVMGGAIASEQVAEIAYELGRRIAEQDWVLLNGGRDAGVMAASARGASEAGGLVVGILPYDDTHGVSPHVDIAIPTGMGDARNMVNVLASHVVIALPGGAGTVSEVALALKSGKSVVNCGLELGGALAPYYERGQLIDATTPAEVMAAVRKALPKELL
jgi:uncharacterized protein (TIGR00725 family)